MDIITDEAQLEQHRQDAILEQLRQRVEADFGQRQAEAFMRDVEEAEIDAIKARNAADLLEEIASHHHAPTGPDILTDAEVDATLQSFLKQNIDAARQRHRARRERIEKDRWKLRFFAEVDAALEREDPDVIAGVEEMVQRLHRESPHATPSYAKLQEALWEHYSELDWVSFLPEV